MNVFYSFLIFSLCEMWETNKDIETYARTHAREYISQNHYAADSNAMGLFTWYVKFIGMTIIISFVYKITVGLRCLTAGLDCFVDYLLNFTPIYGTLVVSNVPLIEQKAWGLFFLLLLSISQKKYEHWRAVICRPTLHLRRCWEVEHTSIRRKGQLWFR